MSESYDSCYVLMHERCYFQKQEGQKKEITVLDPKRSNGINIGLTVLPPTRTIKTAILKMDTSILNREGIEVNDRMLCVFGIPYSLT